MLNLPCLSFSAVESAAAYLWQCLQSHCQQECNSTILASKCALHYSWQPLADVLCAGGFYVDSIRSDILLPCI